MLSSFFTAPCRSHFWTSIFGLTILSLSTSSTVLSFRVLLAGIFAFFPPCAPLSLVLQDILTLKHAVHVSSVSGPFVHEKQFLPIHRHQLHGTGRGIASVTAG